MSHLQVKNVPEPMYEALRNRAATDGTSIRDYVLKVLERELRRPSLREWLADVDAHRPAATATSEQILAAIDAERGEWENSSG